MVRGVICWTLLVGACAPGEAGRGRKRGQVEPPSVGEVVRLGDAVLLPEGGELTALGVGDHDADGVDDLLLVGKSVFVTTGDPLSPPTELLETREAITGGIGELTGDAWADLILLRVDGSVDNLSVFAGPLEGPDKSHALLTVDGADRVLVGNVVGSAIEDLLVLVHPDEELPGLVSYFDGPLATGDAPVATLMGEEPADQLGQAVWLGPDLTGDGLRETLVLAWGLRLYGGLVVDRAYAVAAPSGTVWLGHADMRWEGSFDGVGDGGDIDGDGDAELLSWDADAVRVTYLPDPVGVGPHVVSEEPYRLEIVGRAGDLDGDGFGDIVVAAPYGDPPPLYLLYGPIEGTRVVEDDAVVLLPDADCWPGEELVVGDLDGDGRDDLVISAHAQEPTDGAYLLFGW